MKYFRYYPWILQLMLLLLMLLTLLSFTAWCLGMCLPKMAGISLLELSTINEHSPAVIVHAALVSHGLLSMAMFLATSLLFAYFTHPNVPFYLGFRKPGKPWQLLMAVTLMICAQPLLQGLESLVSLLPFSKEMRDSQAASEALMNTFLDIHSFPAFLLAFLIVAIVPAVGEELFFRGLLMKFSTRASGSISFGIVFSSAIFALAHGSLFNLLPIFVAGVILAMLYYYTGSIWVNIAAHLTFNGFQVVLSYLANQDPGLKKLFENPGSFGAGVLAVGAIGFGLAAFWYSKNKTLLPVNWVEDFTPEEKTTLF